MVKFNTKVIDKTLIEMKHYFGTASKDYNCVYCDSITKNIVSFPPFYEDVPICSSKECVDWICNIITSK